MTNQAREHHRTRRLAVALTLVISTAAGTPAMSADVPGQGQGGTSWVGRKVVTKYQTPLRDGNRRLAPDAAHHVFTVEKVQGRWLQLVSAGQRGWVQASQVVPFDQAVGFYTREIRNGTNPPRAHVQRGLLYEDRGDSERAIADFTEAIRLNPSCVEAFQNRARVWLARGEVDIALADLTDVIRLRPRDFQTYLERGLAWERKGKLDLALADFNESIRQEPNNPWAYNDRANLERDRGAFDRAIADCDRALALDPGFIPSYINRGLAWGAKRMFDRAVADCDRALLLDPGNAFVQNNRAVFLAALGDYPRAVAGFEAALRLDPTFQAARAGLALLLASCPDASVRNGSKAVALATEAYEATKPEDPVLCAALAAAFAETGNFARAVQFQEAAVRLATSPEERDAHRARVDLYRAKTPYRQGPPAVRVPATSSDATP